MNNQPCAPMELSRSARALSRMADLNIDCRSLTSQIKDRVSKISFCNDLDEVKKNVPVSEPRDFFESLDLQIDSYLEIKKRLEEVLTALDKI